MNGKRVVLAASYSESSEHLRRTWRQMLLATLPMRYVNLIHTASCWKYNLGAPLYYSLLGRRLFGPAMKYPLLRLAHFPERWMRRHLYLHFAAPPRFRTPADVPVPARA